MKEPAKPIVEVSDLCAAYMMALIDANCAFAKLGNVPTHEQVIGAMVFAATLARSGIKAEHRAEISKELAEAYRKLAAAVTRACIKPEFRAGFGRDMADMFHAIVSAD